MAALSPWRRHLISCHQLTKFSTETSSETVLTIRAFGIVVPGKAVKVTKYVGNFIQECAMIHSVICYQTRKNVTDCTLETKVSQKISNNIKSPDKII